MSEASLSTTRENDNLETTARYLAALSSGASSEEIEHFYTPDIIQEEFPNRFSPNGAVRDLAALRDAGERGRLAMSRQNFELLNAVASGDQVAAEVQWIGVLATPVGSLPAGGEMRARFALFLEFREGKIARQRNYDCFDPW